MLLYQEKRCRQWIPEKRPSRSWWKNQEQAFEGFEYPRVSPNYVSKSSFEQFLMHCRKFRKYPDTSGKSIFSICQLDGQPGSKNAIDSMKFKDNLFILGKDDLIVDLVDE